MSEILIDICVPTCNSKAAYLQQAIESAQKQTETRWHMYIHDDGSTTNVEAIVKPYLTDKRITWHPNRKKLGIGGNWNATVALGTAPFVQFLFQDDWWEPNFLERGIHAMQDESVGIVTLGHRYVSDADNELMKGYNALEEFRKKEYKPGTHDGRSVLKLWLEKELHPNFVGEPDFTMMRRSVMEKAGKYLEDMPQNLDMEYAMRMLLESNWHFITDNCGYFRVHNEATSAINQREGYGVFDRFRCFQEILKKLPAGEDRELAMRARNRALDDMARKYLARRKSGKTTKTGGSGGSAFKKFAMRHPLLIGRTMIRAWKSASAL